MRLARLLYHIALPLCLGTAGTATAGKTTARPAIRTEVKVMIAAGSIRRAEKTLALATKRAEKRAVYFFDTSDLGLFGKGLVLRARKVSGRADDSTVKRRPLTSSRVAASWFSVDGFKCEIDRVGTRSVSSCSLTAGQKRGEIGSVAAGKRGIDKLFSKDQERFLATSGTRVDWKKLRVLGPVSARVWKVQRDDFADKLTAERWQLPDRRVFLEVSTKVPSSRARSTASALAKLLSRLGLAPDTSQSTKTRTVLEYFAKRKR